MGSLHIVFILLATCTYLALNIAEYFVVSNKSKRRLRYAERFAIAFTVGIVMWAIFIKFTEVLK